MKEFAIRNEWLSFDGSSYVCDLEENKILEVDGTFLSLSRKKTIKTLDGTIKYIVKNEVFSLLGYRSNILNSNEEIVATVRKKIFSFHDRYFVENSIFGNIEIIGNILGYNYKIYLNENCIGHISRKISLRDSFILSIDDTKIDYYFVIALVIALDNITDRTRKHHNHSSSNHE